MKPDPVFTTVRAQLVERKDRPGMLGVHLQGGRFVCPLPVGYDGRTSVTFHQGYLLVAHPDFPPLLADPSRGTVQLIDPGHIEARDGRMKLLTH